MTVKEMSLILYKIKKQESTNNMKAKTINLQGQDYAKVSERVRLFREDCPQGSIETVPTFMEGEIMFKTTVTKDLENPASAKATGHAIGKNTGSKAFEKLESISVGRALAMLGYLASGEIASSDEMEEFMAYQQEKKDDAMNSLKSAKNNDELKQVFMSLGNQMADKDIIKLKDELKLKFNENNQSTTK